jgi:o-succinylbenzoate synthase
MIITALHWQAVSLRFARPFATSRGRMSDSRSWIVTLETAEGIRGHGEAMPRCEVASGDRLASAVEDELLAWRRRLVGHPLAIPDLPVPRSPSEAAVSFAIETAVMDALAQHQGVPLATLLGEPRSAVPVNATIGSCEPEDAAREAAQAAAAGFPAVKLKVGGRPLTADVARVAAVREAIGPAVALRLDANGAWRPDEAVAILQALAPYQIDYVEQPVRPGRLAELVWVRKEGGVPIAADESVTSPAQLVALLAAEAVNVVVLKPMVLGGLRRCVALAQLARTAGVRVVITSSLESGIGTAAALHLAAALPADTPPCGLATIGLLEHDLLTAPLPLDRGVMTLPDRPGLGVQPDARVLARYRVREDAP